MAQTSYAYDDRVRARYHSIISTTENVHRANGIHPDLLPVTTPPDTGYRYGYSQLPHPPSAPHHESFHLPSQIVHPSYSHFPVGSEHSNDVSAAYGNQNFARPSGIYSPWSSFYTSPDLLASAHCEEPIPSFHQTARDPTLYTDSLSRHPSWPTAEVRVGSVHGAVIAPTNHELLTFPLQNSAAPSYPDLDNISEAYSQTWDPSYHCQWVTDGVICDAVVQATRSHMNRHLHTHHGFGGSDTRPTRCSWAGCEATMQQGSIARHMVTCHLQAKVTCPMCSKKLSRQDVISKHQRVCPAAGTWR